MLFCLLYDVFAAEAEWSRVYIRAIFGNNRYQVELCRNSLLFVLERSFLMPYETFCMNLRNLSRTSLFLSSTCWLKLAVVGIEWNHICILINFFNVQEPFAKQNWEQAGGATTR